MHSYNNCNFYYNFYKNLLRIYKGIGNIVLNDKDYLLSYYKFNENYMSNCKVTKQNATQFSGIMAPIFCGATIEKIKYYFANDQEALVNGLIKGESYYLTQTNTYGLPAGILKEITEDFNS